jgi:hypothetical protein
VAAFEEQPRDVLDRRCFAGSADAQIADAHDRPRQLPPAFGMLQVPADAPGGGGAVE